MTTSVQRLEATIMAREAIPANGSVIDGLAFLLDRNRIAVVALRAKAEARRAIDAVKLSEGNPYGDDDEAIASAILKEIEAKKAKDW